ncbi:MAG: type I glyceraldehyde-3-phosphate dehydrogenase [Oscillospiraceae bacterium]|nr:type I glyceraldehyde-3-phosphate dehydrogenase [Oscillospiraceae bacterium]
MAIKVGINGFGRIGRLAARVLLKREDIDLVAINAPDKTPEMIVYAFTHDTVHGRWTEEVKAEGDVIHFGNETVKLLNNRDPSKLGWGELGCDYVLECTGKFLSAEAVQPHLDAGAKFVLMSAPAKDKTPMFVYGVNHESFDPALQTASAASCTTNCLAPVAKVLNDNFGIVEGLMTTVHAATASQNLVDEYSAKNFRLGRSTYCNIIPTTTGAAKAVGKVIPELNGKLTGMAMRIPAADGSVVDLTVRLEKAATMEEINAAMKAAAEGEMKGVLDYETDEVVSSDFIGTTFASIYDSTAGIALNDHFVKLVAWYDNEMGFTQNMIRLMVHIAHAKGDK